MKLYTSALSPFARKCQILIRAKGIDVEEISARKDRANGYGSTLNPMGKIPVLALDDGQVLYDSLVICEYLDCLDSPWLAAEGLSRWEALRLHRTGDGLSEAVYNFRYETVRDPALHWDEMIIRHETAIQTIVKALNKEASRLSTTWNFETISLVCALDYADFRAGHLDWKSLAPDLAKWHEGFTQDPIWAATNMYV